MFEAKLDFHGYGPLTPEQACLFVDNFLEASYAEKYKQVLIVTGKGEGKLRRIVYAHLPKNKLVASFKSASDWNGGTGAFEVYLKDC
jgi:dsDNA-specific endonuclease/ATPase MutS2